MYIYVYRNRTLPSEHQHRYNRQPQILTYIASIFVVFPSVHSTPNTGDINWWCDQTPYPEQCKFHIRQNSEHGRQGSTISRKEFLSVAEEIALKEVISKLKYTMSLEHRVLNAAERSAWSTCVRFYNLTVTDLNKILDETTKSTAVDVQVWLTCGKTNIYSCNDGFTDVNVTSNIYPLVSTNNMTQLITNCLAINEVFAYEQQVTEKKRVPSSFNTKSFIDQNPDSVVAQDGSGDYTSITAALEASNKREDFSKKFVIHVKQGTYAEYVVVARDMKNIVLIGDGVDNTIITGNKSQESTGTLSDCATFVAYGEGFIAAHITFENTAGASAEQAIAFMSASDFSGFYQCAFKGYQDTLYTYCNRQFYQSCEIYGTVDYIFGNAAVVFQNSIIYARQSDRETVITAQGKANKPDWSGIVLQNCTVAPAPDFQPEGSPVYLGRPWRDYSTVVVMQSELEDLVNPAGWLEWSGAPENRYSTLYYAEYNNKGPGSETGQRVKWEGYHIIEEPSELYQFTVENFVTGTSWLPDTGIPYYTGMGPDHTRSHAVGKHRSTPKHSIPLH